METTLAKSLVVYGTSGCLLLAACAPVVPLSEYTPVVDPAHISQKRFDSDLAACRAIAEKLSAEYIDRQQKEAMQNMMIGLVAGALIGAAVGSNSSYQGEAMAYGATSGMIAGASEGEYTADLVANGPKRVVDRCMTDRHYTILNDIGRG